MGKWGIIRFLFRAVLFRAAHGQCFAAGPRQGHFVLDPRKMHSHFSAFDGGMIVLFTERMNVCEKV